MSGVVQLLEYGSERITLDKQHSQSIHLEIGDCSRIRNPVLISCYSSEAVAYVVSPRWDVKHGNGIRHDVPERFIQVVVIQCQTGIIRGIHVHDGQLSKRNRDDKIVHQFCGSISRRRVDGLPK